MSTLDLRYYDENTGQWEAPLANGVDLDALRTKLTTHLAETISQQILTSRDLSLSGNQIVTGFTKKPKRLDILAVVSGTKMYSIGNYSNNGTVQTSIFQASDGTYGAWNTPIILGVNITGVNTRGSIVVNEDNSITISWFKDNGGATGTVDLLITAHYHGGNN